MRFKEKTTECNFIQKYDMCTGQNNKQIKLKIYKKKNKQLTLSKLLKLVKAVFYSRQSEKCY